MGEQKQDSQVSRRGWVRAGQSLLAVLVLTTLVAGCGSTGSSTNSAGSSSTGSSGGSAPSSQPTVVTVGTLPLVSSAPIYLAKGLGYWKKLGLDVQIRKFTAAGAIDVAAAANSIDVSATGITASLFNLWNSGKHEYIVADKGRIWPGQQFEALVASNQAWNAGVHSVANLKGKRFGNTAAGSTFDYLLGTMLAQKGLSLKDIQDVPLTTLPNMISAVESGQVDATILPQPFANLALKSGKVHLLGWVDHHVKADLLVIAYSPQFRKDQSAAVKFMEGYLEAVRFYSKHVYQNSKASDPELKKAEAIIAHYTHAKPATIPGSLVYIDPNAQVDVTNIGKQLTFYRANGFVNGSVNVAQMVDSSFLRAAVKKLG